MPRSRLRLLVLVLAVQIGDVGCSAGGSGQPETAPVRGRVTYRGQPVADATVVFIRAGAPRFASGRTDAEGRFQLTMIKPGDGAAIGDNVITIVKRQAPIGADVSGADPASADNAAVDAAFDRAASRASARSLIPVKYSQQNTSDLKRNVTSGENEFEIGSSIG